MAHIFPLRKHVSFVAGHRGRHLRVGCGAAWCGVLQFLLPAGGVGSVGSVGPWKQGDVACISYRYMMIYVYNCIYIIIYVYVYRIIFNGICMGNMYIYGICMGNIYIYT